MSTLILPLKVIYIDVLTSWYPDPTLNFRECADAGFSVIILAFYLLDSSVDALYAWSNVATPQQRQSTLDYIHSKGVKLMLAAGGATIAPFLDLSGEEYGTRVAQFANTYQLDGVDFDLENFSPGLTYPPLNSQQVIDWLVSCTNACRNILGPNKILSHAPQAPYFGPIGDSTTWVGLLGGYSAVNQAVGSSIDFYNIQFYNQGDTCYTSYNSLFKSSCSSFPQTSVTQIANAGNPLNKLVVGKPLLQSDASNGYVDPAVLGSWFTQAGAEFGWNAGVMTWQFHDQASSKNWLDNVYPSSATITRPVPEIYGYNCHRSHKKYHKKNSCKC